MIGSVTNQGIENIGNREYSSQHGDGFPFDPMGIPRTVPALLMVGDYPDGIPQEGDVLNDLCADVGMLAHDLTLIRSERSGLM